jgi:UDP-N-acetyl-alpha-D-quinovosamine dehydrogenase
VTRVLVTGGSGFIGTAVCTDALAKGWKVRAAVRGDRARVAVGAEHRSIADVRDAAWEPALEGVDAVIHLAGIAHELRGQDAEEVYHAVNCAATERLARAAARAGVRRFVFASSIKVNGESTPLERPFRAADAARPQDRYARSKWCAERALAKVAAETGLETAVIRPPLVYGPGVGANFLRLIRLVDSGIPLPFGSIRNRRSFIYLGNLVDLIVLCATSSTAAGKTLLCSDGEDLGTPELVTRIAKALGRLARLWPMPPRLLPAKLAQSLAIDPGETRRYLEWRPKFTVDDGLAHTTAWYRSRRTA